MKKHLFTSIEVADGLNARVQAEIDPRLFITANFKLPIDRPPSPSGKYYQYIQTLYRFAIDTSCVISHAFGYLKDRGVSMNRFSDLGNSGMSHPLQCIAIARACTDHNVAEENGLFQREQEKLYRQWMADVLDNGDGIAKTEDDYDRLCIVMETMADALVNALHDFITEVAAMPDNHRESLVNAWIKDTLKWYSRSSTAQDLYLGQMALFYEAEQSMNRMYDRNGEFRKPNMRTVLEVWLRNYYYAQAGTPRSLLDKIDNTHPAEDKCAINAFFGNGFSERLRETMNNYPGITLLPQDLLQRDIVDRLEPVPKTLT